MTLHDLPADRKSHPRPLVRPAPVQPLERHEDAAQVLLVEAYAVVLDEDLTGSVA